MDQIHGLLRRNLLPGHIARGMISHITLKCFRHFLYITMIHKISREICSGPYSFRKFFSHFFIGYIYMSFLHSGNHFTITDITAVPEFSKRTDKCRILPVNVQPQNMNIPSFIIRRKLQSRYKLQSKLFRCFHCLCYSADCIMIRQRHCRQSFFGSVSNQLRWCQCSIRTTGMYMQVNIFITHSHAFSPLPYLKPAKKKRNTPFRI